MYTIINMIDRTNVIDPNPISFEASLSDPASKFDFTLDDINQNIKLTDFMPVIVFDENAPTINGVSPIPAMNFALDALLSTPIGVNNLWRPGGTNSGLLAIAGGGSGYVMTFANSPVATGYVQQITVFSGFTGLPVPGYVQPGVKYMWSVYVTGTAPVAIQYFLQVDWLDSNQALLSSVTMTPATPPLSRTRINISGTAPANAVYAQIRFGGQATNATNSGTILFQSVQFEPMWFGWNGVQYPTPDCNFNQADTVEMPDGTCSRKCRIFAGYIEDLIRTYVGKQRYYAVQCASGSKILEVIGLISASFTSQYDTFILNAVLSNLPGIDGCIGSFSTNQQNQYAPQQTIIQGVLIDSVSYANNTMREVLNGLADHSGSQFYMDPYYYLWYVPPGFVSATIGLSDTPDYINTFAYHDFSMEDDGTAPGNTITVVGSKQIAAVITDTFSGNGSQTVFNLSKPPHTTHAVTVTAANIRTGVDGVDNAKFGPSLTFKALINKQAQTIKFATAPPNAANNTVVSYTYEDQVISQVIAADAVSTQGLPFNMLVNDSNITSTTAAKNRGLAQLTRNAFPRQILTLSALNIYIPVGSLILFTCQAESCVAAPFTVQTVRAVPQGGGVYKWDYTAGSYNPTIIDHIRNIHKAVKRNPTTSNVVIIASIDVAIFDNVHLSDSIVVNANGAPPAGPYVYGGPTALTLYGSSVADVTLTNACDMAIAGGGVETSKTTTPTGTNNFCEIYSQSGSPASVATIPGTPTGHGWVYKPGASTMVAGNWSASLTLSGTALGTSDLTIRFFKYSGGVYTSIGSINKTGIVSAKTNYNFPATAMSSVSFGANDLIYVDLWLHDASNVSGNAPIIYESTSSSTGVNGDMTVVTAGLSNATVGALYGFATYS